MPKPHEMWRDQCAATGRIRAQYGFEKAIGYLVGEKLVNFVRVSAIRPEYAAELSRFVDGVRCVFTQEELAAYLETVRRVGAFAHVCSDEEIERLRAAVAFAEDPVHDAEDVLIVERLKEMLLDR